FLDHGSHSESNDSPEDSPQEKEKGGGSCQGNFSKENLHYEHGGSEHPPSRLQEDDGNVVMRDVHEDPQVRHNSSTLKPNNSCKKWHNEYQDKITPEREMEKNMQDGALGCWFKITIPHGIKYDKTWLMNSIQTHCSVPFTPVDFHYIKNRARFFVQDARTASALKDVKNKIFTEENKKISIFVSPSAVPYSIENKLNPEQMEQLKLTMNKRYDVSQQALDLHKLRFDPDLVQRDMDIILNRRNCMAATLQIIERNFPELLSLNLRNNRLYRLDGLSDIIEKAPKVKILNLSKNELKSAWELSKVKGLKLEELWLEGNPLCHTFRGQSAYIRSVETSDGQELTSPTTIDAEFPEIIKPCKGNFEHSFRSQTIDIACPPLLPHRYYLIYDSGDRQSLLEAYHEVACFSLTIPFGPEDPASNGLCEYFKDSRNMKKVKDPDLRVQLLKHTKHEIVDSLSVFPKTQHDLNSYVIDLCVQKEKMLYFSVNGVFKEVEGQSQGCVRAFTRTFILTSGSNSSMYIVNDELIVRNASPKEIQNAFSTPVPTPFSSSMLTFSQEQQEMVQTSSTQSEMNLKRFQKCLQDNEQNYTKADQVFATLQVRYRNQVGKKWIFLGLQECQEGGGWVDWKCT
uniref:Nuclear RNA export factor 2 n=1 Tax=Prolemur simus TaxID=1328070 RepID=A0A8C8ZXQ5_PROSS